MSVETVQFKRPMLISDYSRLQARILREQIHREIMSNIISLTMVNRKRKRWDIVEGSSILESGGGIKKSSSWIGSGSDSVNFCNGF